MTPPRALIERENELAVIDTALEAAAHGDGKVVTISGNAGLGKTRLLQAAADRAREMGYQVVSVRGAQLEQQLGWGVATDAIEPLLERRTPAKRLRLLSGRAMLVRTLLDPADHAHTAGDSAPAQVAALASALTLLTRRLASEQTLAVIVDDAHWADSPSLRWLNHLALRLTEVSAALLVGFRANEPQAPADLLEALSEAAAFRLELSPLSPRGTSDLVEAKLGRPTDGPAIHDVTSGNPFIIEQLLEHLGPAALRPGAMRDARPRKLRSLVLPRLTRLGSDVRRLSETVAVLGEDTDLSTAATVAGLSEEAAAAAAGGLAAAGIFTDELPLNFTHPLLRSVVADVVPAARADLLRRGAARVLAAAGVDPPDAAVHLLSAGRVGELWSGELLRAAGRRSIARGAPETAAAFFRRSLVEPSDVPRHELLLDYGSALLQAGSADALGVLETAFDETPHPLDRARVALGIGDALMALDRPAEAVDVYERGINAVEDLDGRLRVHLLAQRALAAIALTDAAERSIAAVIEAIEAADRLPSARVRSALALRAVVAVWTGQPRDACVTLLEEALAATPYGDRSTLEWVPALGWIMPMLAWCDSHEQRARFLDSVISRARRRGAVVDVALATSHRAYGLIRQGRVREAEKDALASIDVFKDLQEGANAIATASALEALIARGAFQAAEVVASSSAPAQGEDRVVYLAFLEARARLRIAQERFEEAAEDLEFIGNQVESHSFLCPAAAAWRAQLAVVRHALGDPVDARRLAREDVERARAFGAPRTLGIALVALASVNEPALAIIALREAVGVLARSPARLEYARALVALGALLGQRRHRAQAVVVLRQGLEVAEWCGAEAVASAALLELELLSGWGWQRRAHEQSAGLRVGPGSAHKPSLARQ